MLPGLSRHDALPAFGSVNACCLTQVQPPLPPSSGHVDLVEGHVRGRGVAVRVEAERADDGVVRVARRRSRRRRMASRSAARSVVPAAIAFGSRCDDHLRAGIGDGAVGARSLCRTQPCSPPRTSPRGDVVDTGDGAVDVGRGGAGDVDRRAFGAAGPRSATPSGPMNGMVSKPATVRPCLSARPMPVGVVPAR